MLDRAGRGTPVPPPEPMPLPEHRLRLAMRDGIRLHTNVWLPAQGAGPAPAILLRTPYKESTLGFKRLGVLRYVESGYAVVIQQIRGVGRSEGRFAFNAPHERSDGHDTVEWIAAQPWCSGAVGMDGSSYAAMMQIAAALAHPPHLKCIVPAVPSLDFFREAPYCGGIFSRMHTLNWLRLVQIDTLNDLGAGFMGTLPLISDPANFARMTSRPLMRAAEGFLEDDYLQHYLDALAHSCLDDWWRARTCSAAELTSIDIPALVVTGNFDASVGALALWRGVAHEGRSEHKPERRLLIGPWDHGQCYAGGAPTHGPYTMGEHSVVDLGALRLAFLDEHLKGVIPRTSWEGPVRVFTTGSNTWHRFDHFPPREAQPRTWHLASRGRANAARGDGRLLLAPDPAWVEPDQFVDDPSLPFVAGVALAGEPGSSFDLREREQHHETLVYDSGPLAEPLTLLGEGVADLHVAADAPDADVILWLAEHRADGATVRLAFGQLRLRYREGFDAERLLLPGEPVAVRIPITYVAHTLPAGSHLRLLVGGNNFPLADPNPHTGEPVATASTWRRAVQTVFHDPQRPSRLTWPVLA